MSVEAFTVVEHLPPDELVEHAYAAEKNGQLEYAASVWDEVRRRAPENFLGFVSGGLVLKRLGRLRKAIAVLAEGTVRFPDNEWMAKEHAWAVHQSNDAEQAARLWRHIRTAFPLNSDGYVGGGLVARRTGVFEEAEIIYASGIEHLPEQQVIRIDHAWCAHERGDVAESVRRWQVVNDMFPDFPMAYLRRGVALLELGQFEPAETALAEAVARQPEDLEARIAHAWCATRRGALPASVERWAVVTTKFPDLPDGYLRQAESLLALGRPEEADRVLQHALERHPAHEETLATYARAAERRGAEPEARRRWERLAAVFPEGPLAGVRRGTALLDAGQWEEAETVLSQAVEHAPDDEAALTAHAWVAQRRGRWSEALTRWDRILARTPNRRDAREQAARALLELGRWSEGMTVLAPALRLHPDDWTLVSLNAWLATRGRAIDLAEPLWRAARERFPQFVDGYHGYGVALRDAGRLDEADAMLVEAARRFPTNRVVAWDLANLPERRRNWRLAVSRFRVLVNRFADFAPGYIGLGNSLAGARHDAEAEEIFKSALERFPHDPAVATAAAETAARRGDWTLAGPRYADLAARFPDHAPGFSSHGRALREAGELAAAATALTTAAGRFPDDLGIAVELALTLSAQRDWHHALTLWAALKTRYPQSAEVQAGVTHILGSAITDQQSGSAEFEIPAVLLPEDAAATAKSARLTALFKRFESLGDTCEFGMVQRMHHVEHVSLLRWACTSPQNLVRALQARFAGVGDPEHTIVSVKGDEYVTQDRRYFMHTHTFTSPAAEPLETFAQEQCRRMQWLRRRMLDGLTTAARIYVYKYEEGVTDDEALALYRALTQYSPHNRLLVVRIEEPGFPSGTLNRKEHGLFVGYIDRFSTSDISMGVWHTLCDGVCRLIDPLYAGLSART